METLELVRLPAPVLAAPRDLAGTLHDLDIGVHPERQVRQFQRRFRRSTYFAAMKQGDNAQLLAGFLAAGLVLGMGAWAGFGPSWPRVIASALVSVLSMIFLAVAAILPIDLWRQVRWRSYGLRTSDVPPEAVCDAVRIAAALPGVQFQIEYLEKDPFLWAICGAQRYCIAHWDEPFVEA